jgi:hypothetical protein
MKRRLAGTFLVLHGFAHTLAGMRVTDATRWTSGGSGVLLWVATVLWWAAAAGLVAAGLGLLGAAPFRRRWRVAACIGVAASATLLLAFWTTAWAIPALLANAAIAFALWRTDEAPRATAALPRRPHRLLRGMGAVASAACVAWLSLLVLARPWYQRWGSTAGELLRPLPGDEAGAAPNFQIQHAVSIRARPEEVWPWLAQLGHDRGGFYSYSWLERAFGDHVRNAGRVHPEWQDVRAGGFVFATQRGYLGGMLGDSIGWRVHAVVPGRALVLERWGTFAVQPAGDSASRLVIRTRAGDQPIPVQWAPVELLMFEPAHFIMERGMMLGIRARAERAARADA